MQQTTTPRLKQRVEQFYETKWYWMLMGAGAMAIFDLAMEAIVWVLKQQQATGGVVIG